ATPTLDSLADRVAVEQVPAGPPAPTGTAALLAHVPQFGAQLAGRLQAERPDVVHAQSWICGLVALDAVQRLGLPVVQTFRGLGSLQRRHQRAADSGPPAQVRIEPAIAGAVDRVIVTSTQDGAELRRLGVRKHRIVTVPAGVDPDRFQVAPMDLSRRAEPRVLCLGRLDVSAGVDDVICALAKVPGARLVVAGGPAGTELDADPNVVRLRKTAQALGVQGRVTFVGRVAPAAVPALIRSVDLVVCSPWYEALGAVALEALASGVPVVASAVGALKDIVLPGVTGELVPARSPNDLAVALRRLIAEPVRLQSYRFAAADRARAAYSWQRVAAATEAVYLDVLAAARPPLPEREAMPVA
ncbi:MAG: glycosyltransferase, partial [Actinomycetota bacterium]|nr:glycosyltransferase [Actinomycetota bacterium]